MLAEAALTSDTALKSVNMMLESGADDHEKIGIVEDIFDGPPDDRLATVESGGPGSSIPPGKVGVGPAQESSGAGAAKMEGHYSRHAPQSGVQRATEALGAKLASQTRVLKAIAAFGKSLNERLSMVEMALSTTALSTATVDTKTLDAAVGKAVADALGKSMPAMLVVVELPDLSTQ